MKNKLQDIIKIIFSKSGFIIILTMFFININNAQNKNFYAETDAKEVFTNSYIDIKFVLNNIEGSNFKPPTFKGFKLVSGPSTSSEYSLINGQHSSKKTFTYTIQSINPGTFKISSATINVKNKKLKTNAFVIKVVKRDKTKTKIISDEDKFFVKTSVSDSVVYPGQELILKYILYTSINISNYNLRSESDYDGFIARSINTQDKQKRILINNREYVVYTLKSIALFPQKTGRIKIQPANVVLSVPDGRSRNIFFRSSKSFNVTSQEIEILVKPLPPKPDESYSDNVGKFTIKSRITKRKVSTDDAFPLVVTIDGNGSAKYIEAPNLENVISEFEVYDPNLIKEKEYLKNGQLYAKKTFEYLLVPKKAGNFNIKIPYTYFDTDSTKYVTIYSKAGRINVFQGKNNGKKDLDKILKKYQLKPNKPSDYSTISKHPFFGSTLYWFILGIILSIIPTLYFYKQYLIKQGNLDPTLVKRKKAGKEAQKRLKKAQELMESNEKALFYKEISDALLKFVADKLNISNSDLSKHNVQSKLIALGISNQRAEEYIQLLEYCEIALYAASPDQDLNSKYTKTKELITELQMEL